MIAILNVSGERTTGSGPYYGVLHAVFPDDTAPAVAWAAADDLCRKLHAGERFNVQIGYISDVSEDVRIGDRIKYLRHAELATW